MAKEWLLGSMPMLIIFFLYLGYNVGPLLFLAFILGATFFFLQRQGRWPLSQGKKGSREVKETGVTFEDIGGLKKTKQELKEALDFLLEDERANRYGIRPLKGILLTGPPGTGKTLLAKAAAQYTQAAFVAASGSEFVEMYVGVGASRIRKLFREVKQLAREKGLSRGVIFIDEIDVIGGIRSGKQQKEYDQTLNQLLTEMDGISTSERPRILMIAATNRVDMLDPALLRPGRFDRQIQVDLPDKKGRQHILEIHFKSKPLADDVNLADVARDTYGFSGAQLESVANEAAIYAFRERAKVINQIHIAQAIEKVMMGEQTDRETSTDEKRRVAIHELGHAICSELLRPKSVSQVVLVPRGLALGYVRQSPPQDRHLYTKTYLEHQIMIALAGAAAEEIFLGEKSTGAQNDFEQAIAYTKKMIESGLSSLGIVSLKHTPKTVLQKEMSRILDQLYERTKELLLDKEVTIRETAAQLIQEERISGEDFRRLFQRYAAHQKEIG